MKGRTVCLIINARSGKNVARLTDLIAVFSAAGWKTDTALKEFGAHTTELAKAAAEAGYDLVIGYGGDGTLNQVVNGVMAAKRGRSIVGVIPGGTANVWAREIGMPEDPVKAALFLLNSEGRKVDLGHVQVDHGDKKKNRPASGGRHHFLLMAGLGIDAAIMRRVSRALKEKIGEAAVALAAAEVLPSQHAFPIEIRSSGEGSEQSVLWKGEGYQIIVGNTRRYGNIAEATPEAHIDDGVLDVCVITAGDPLTTMQQILSTLLRRKQVRGRSEYFQNAHLWIRVPASVNLQLDGTGVKLKGRKPRENKEGGMVTYRFDALPRALRAAIPRVYAGALFETASTRGSAPSTAKRRPDHAQRQRAGPIDALLERGLEVKVVAVGPNPERAGTCIVAGTTSAKQSGESKPVAVRIDHRTTLLSSTGEPLPAAVARELPEGGVIVVEGRHSKRGVIRATRVVIVT